MMWIVAYVEGFVNWPSQETEVTWRGEKFILRPETEEQHADCSLAYSIDAEREDRICLLRQFLSTMSWVDEASLREIGIMGGGGGRFRRGKNPSKKTIQSTDYLYSAHYLPEPTDPDAQLALALYRDALGLNSQPYQYLSFFKILNIRLDKGKDQIPWINQNLSNLHDHRATQRVKELNSSGIIDIGKYLVTARRDAVAHAQLTGRPVINPDDAGTSAQLYGDIHLIRTLAERFIEKELSVKSRMTLWKEMRQRNGYPTK